jgi:putative membrane protein
MSMGSEPQHSRFPRSVYDRGGEPDARFTLANERTFLAWIGTGLALLSVGVGLDSLALSLDAGYRLAASIVLIVGGAACPIQAWFGWAQVERALREKRPLPPPLMIFLLPIILGIAGILVLMAMFT